MKQRPADCGSRFFRAGRTILWAFFGIRRRKHGESDAASLTPLQIVIAGILGGAVFVLVLLVVVRAVVMSHGATT